METILILSFAALAIISLVLRLTKEVRGINDTLNHLVSKKPALQEPTDKKEELTIESVRTALRYNGYSPDDPASDDPDRIWFKIDNTNYSVDASKLPYISLELGFNHEENEEDLELMNQAALETSMRMYMVKICVTPKYYVCRIDILADSYLYLRDTLRRQVNILMEGIHHFMDRYKELRDAKQQSSQEAINAALIAAQNELAGKKITS